MIAEEKRVHYQRANSAWAKQTADQVSFLIDLILVFINYNVV